jgi:protease-4
MDRPWEYALVVVGLAFCLLAGLGLARWAAPKPAIGVVRFDAVVSEETAANLVAILERAQEDDRVAGVVLEIASPGGLAHSSENVFYSLLRLRETKPVITAIDGMAASGGYYMAVAANRSYAPPSASVGNVGARGSRPDDPELSPNELSSGPYKISGGSRFDSIQQLQTVADAFVGNVVNQRQHAEMTPLTIDAQAVAEARIYMGSEGLALGLVDAEGARTDAILAAAELAGVERYDVVDLADVYGIAITPIASTINESVAALAADAPPDAVFLLDSRIPLPAELSASPLDQQLLRLRGNN